MATNILSLFFSLVVLWLCFHDVAAGFIYRRVLHQPLLPLDAYPPAQAPSLSPQPKYPFSFTPTTPQRSFFPSFVSPPPSPPPPRTLPTFPANISSILIPHPSSHPHRRVLVAVSASLLSVAVVLVVVSAVFLRRNLRPTRLKNRSSGDNLRLYPPNVPPSDSPTADRPLNHSSEFLYLGTVINSRGPVAEKAALPEPENVAPRTSGSYQKLGSPEIRPLPPLPRNNLCKKSEVGCSLSIEKEDEEGEEEEFFSPRGSVKDTYSPIRNNSSSSRRMFGGIEVDNYGSRSFNSRTASYPYSNSVSPAASTISSSSPALGTGNFSPRSLSLKSKSPLARSLSSSSMESTPKNSQVSPRMKEFVPRKLPPPPPPLPPLGYWENRVGLKFGREAISPRPLIPVVFETNGAIEKNVESVKPKLKPLHWDKVKASSDRVMVWDQLKSSSFQLNEEMIETLFTLNATNMNQKDNARRQVHPSMNNENRVLDPKKSQNIAILLKALNVTIDEVCEALLEGNADTLGTELLESLMKMAPSKEEERKLKDYKDDSPIKLGPAEKFLKEVIDIPFAFKRVDAMLYIANFDSEVEYLKRSFETLETACGELKNSRMFLKLLEAVLKTGNRMNVGTNRGDAHAFKLDTLLKLVDIKGTDGKTTLLHFVVQEIIRVEGSRLAGATATKNFLGEQPQQPDLRDEVEYRKLGLQVVAGLSGELSNVKKAAAMDADLLTSDLSKLAKGIAKIAEVVELNEKIGSKESSRKFSESMKGFLKRAEEEIVKIQAQERVALSLVKEVTEYFHGNLAKEEAHRLRIFMVVRDFLSILDQVCKEVGRINDRTTVSTARQYAVPVYPNLPPLFPSFVGRQQYGSSDDEDSSP